MEKPLVSLIVPVYNVEEYLRECLESICGQTYKNLEIIIIDDGSTDASYKICEEYVRVDRRIKLIRKENGGLSSARNRGIKEAKGEYIGFIDSDDKLHKYFVQALLMTALRNRCDIVACDFAVDAKRMNCSNYRIRILDKSKAVSELLDDFGYKCYAWNKLYHRWLFDDILFPEGKLFEDIKVMYQIFQRVEQIAYIQAPLYYYRQRKGSITKKAFTQGNYYLLESIEFILSEAKRIKGIDKERILMGYLSYYMGFVRRGILANAEIRNESARLRWCIKKNRISVFRKNNIKVIKKIELIVFAFFPHIYNVLVKLVKL